MTPERLAEIRDLLNGYWPDTFSADTVRELLAEVDRLRAALAEEQEACAQVAEAIGESEEPDLAVWRYIAEAIRARGEGEADD